ncbi:MAG: bifunctional pyr operon transcriptional regulator/uracil phosphoribosyltransferase PyrR [Thermodesulfobacteriota bacterium]
MNGDDIDRSISRMAIQIVEKNRNLNNLAIVGIHTGGVFLAERIKQLIKSREDIDVPIGSLDITLYRDDWSLASQSPVVKTTDLNFPVECCTLVLIDDVLFTGRTIRAALDAIMDFGRPMTIQLAVLIDRGGRELPIQPDFVGLHVNAGDSERVDVLLKEKSGEDSVVLGTK